jgi:hypothetical protein
MEEMRERGARAPRGRGVTVMVALGGRAGAVRIAIQLSRRGGIMPEVRLYPLLLVQGPMVIPERLCATPVAEAEAVVGEAGAGALTGLT